MSDSKGLVDFAIELVNSVLNLPDRQVKYFEEFNLQNNCEIISAHQKVLGGLVEMTFGLVIASFSLPEWQAVKMTFFAHCPRLAYMYSVDHNILSLQPSLFYFGNDLIYFITDYC